MTNVSDYAKLSNAVYGKPAPSGWTSLGGSKPKASGFYGEAYQNASGDIVVSFRGTDDLTDVGNTWIETARQKEHPQYRDAVAFYEDVVQAHSTASISLTGHSLGGVLAQYVEAHSNKEMNRSVTGVTFGSPGIRSYLLKSSHAPVNFNSQLTHYYNFADPAAMIGEHFGAREVIVSGEWMAASVLDSLHVFGSFSAVVAQHSMENYERYLGAHDAVSPEMLDAVQWAHDFVDVFSLDIIQGEFGYDELGGGIGDDVLDYGGKSFTPDSYGSGGENAKNQQVTPYTSKDKTMTRIAKRFEGESAGDGPRSKAYGQGVGVSEQADILTSPSKVLNAGGSLRKAGPKLSNPSANPERGVGERRSVVGPSSRVPQYQAKSDELATAKPRPPQRSPLWPEKSIKNIADAGAFIFEILNSPTQAQLREKQKPVANLKFPTRDRRQDGDDTGDQAEALMRLMMPSKKKKHPPFPVPIEEIARMLLQPRP